SLPLHAASSSLLPSSIASTRCAFSKTSPRSHPTTRSASWLVLSASPRDPPMSPVPTIVTCLNIQELAPQTSQEIRDFPRCVSAVFLHQLHDPAANDGCIRIAADFTKVLARGDTKPYRDRHPSHLPNPLHQPLGILRHRSLRAGHTGARYRI